VKLHKNAMLIKTTLSVPLPK